MVAILGARSCVSHDGNRYENGNRCINGHGVRSYSASLAVRNDDGTDAADACDTNGNATPISPLLVIGDVVDGPIMVESSGMMAADLGGITGGIGSSRDHAPGT